MCDSFIRLLSETASPLGNIRRRLCSVTGQYLRQKILRRRNILKLRVDDGDRDTLVKALLDARRTEVCSRRAGNVIAMAGESVPIDWPHTLAAVYQVRCNLFHGHKAAHSEMEPAIVFRRVSHTSHFFDAGEYLSGHR